MSTLPTVTRLVDDEDPAKLVDRFGPGVCSAGGAAFGSTKWQPKANHASPLHADTATGIER